MHGLLDNAMFDILGCELDEGQQRVVQQPGCRLSRSDRADAANWATWDLHAQVILQLATELGRAVTNMADGDSAEQARQRLGKAGICACPNKLTEDAARVYQSSPWSQERDVTKILGHTTEHDFCNDTHALACLAVEAARLWEMADDELRKVMPSSGGPGNGSMWIAPTKSAQDLLPGAQFMMSTVLKLGCESNATGRLCAHLKLRDDPESQCAQPLDSRLQHTHSHAKPDWRRP